MFEMKVVCETSAINEIIEAIKLVFTFENIVNLVSLVILSMKKQKSKTKRKAKCKNKIQKQNKLKKHKWNQKQNTKTKYTCEYKQRKLTLQKGKFPSWFP